MNAIGKRIVEITCGLVIGVLASDAIHEVVKVTKAMVDTNKK